LTAGEVKNAPCLCTKNRGGGGFIDIVVSCGDNIVEIKNKISFFPKF
jgi:hypothetical protein